MSLKERQHRRPEKAQKMTRADGLLPAPESSSRCYDYGWIPPKKTMARYEVEEVIRRGDVGSLVRVLDKGTVEEAGDYRKAGVVELPEDLQEGLVSALYKKRRLQRVLSNLKIYGATIAGVSALIAGCLAHVSGGLSSGAMAMIGIFFLTLGHIALLKKGTDDRGWCWQKMLLLYNGRNWAEPSKELLEHLSHGKTALRRLRLPIGNPEKATRESTDDNQGEG